MNTMHMILAVAFIVVCVNFYATWNFYKTYEEQAAQFEQRIASLETSIIKPAKRKRVPPTPPESTLGPESKADQLYLLDELLKQEQTK